MRISLILIMFVMIQSCAHRTHRALSSFGVGCNGLVSQILDRANFDYSELSREISFEIISPTDWKKEIDTIRVELSIVRRKLKELPPNIDHPQTSLNRSKLIQLKKNYAKAKINHSISRSSEISNNFIFTRHTNTGSYKHMGKKSVLKPFWLKAKTSKKGLVKGLIPHDQSLVGSLDEIKITQYARQVDALVETGELKVIPFTGMYENVAVLRNGEQIFTDNIIEGDKVIKIIANEEGYPLTSDIDVFTFAFSDSRLGREMVSRETSEKFGSMKVRDHDLIQLINRKFLSTEGDKGFHRRIVQHAPESFNPNAVEVDFPIRVYTPTGHILRILEGPENDPLLNIRQFILLLRSEGFAIDTNPSWGF